MQLLTFFDFQVYDATIKTILYFLIIRKTSFAILTGEKCLKILNKEQFEEREKTIIVALVGFLPNSVSAQTKKNESVEIAKFLLLENCQVKNLHGRNLTGSFGEADVCRRWKQIYSFFEFSAGQLQE